MPNHKSRITLIEKQITNITRSSSAEQTKQMNDWKHTYNNTKEK